MQGLGPQRPERCTSDQLVARAPRKTVTIETFKYQQSGVLLPCRETPWTENCGGMPAPPSAFSQAFTCHAVPYALLPPQEAALMASRIAIAISQHSSTEPAWKVCFLPRPPPSVHRPPAGALLMLNTGTSPCSN